MTPRRFNIWFLSVCFAGLVTVASLNAIAASRIVSLTKEDSELGWTFSGSRSQHGFVLRFNSLGLRGGEINVRDVPLLLLGNSVTMGQAVPEDQTFASILGAVNAGLDGYDTYQMSVKLRRDLAGLRPLAVGLIVVGNDVISREASKERILQTKANNKTVASKNLDINLGRYFSFNLREFRARIENKNPDDSDSDAKDKGYLQMVSIAKPVATWGDWTDAIREIRSVSPKRFFIAASPPRSQVRAWRSGSRDFWFNNELSHFAKNNQVCFIDMLPGLAKYDPGLIYDDFVHFNSRGHAIAAQVIREGLANCGI